MSVHRLRVLPKILTVKYRFIGWLRKLGQKISCRQKQFLYLTFFGNINFLIGKDWLLFSMKNHKIKVSYSDTRSLPYSPISWDNEILFLQGLVFFLRISWMSMVSCTMAALPVQHWLLKSLFNEPPNFAQLNLTLDKIGILWKMTCVCICEEDWSAHWHQVGDNRGLWHLSRGPYWAEEMVWQEPQASAPRG